MSRLQTITIAKLAEVRSGGGAPQDPSAFSNDGHPFVRAGSLSRLLNGDDESQLEKITPDVARSHRLQLFPEGTVLFAKSGMSATKGYIYNLKRPAYVVNHLAALVPHDSRDSAFLTRALQRFSPTSLIKDQAYPSIRLGDIEQMEIRSPDSVEARARIAAILDKADALRRKRRRAINLLDSLPQSIFLDMFTLNSGLTIKAETRKLGDVCELIRDGVHKTPNYIDKGIPFVTVRNIVSGTLDLTKTKFVSIDDHLSMTKRFRPEPGDILVSKDGTIGVPCVVPTGPIFSIFVSVALLKLKREIVDPLFLAEQIKTEVVQRQIRDSSKGIAIRHLHLNDFAKLKVVLPNLVDQKRFGLIVSNVRKKRENLVACLESTESLFCSLQSRAFLGQL